MGRAGLRTEKGISGGLSCAIGSWMPSLSWCSMNGSSVSVSRLGCRRSTRRPCIGDVRCTMMEGHVEACVQPSLKRLWEKARVRSRWRCAKYEVRHAPLRRPCQIGQTEPLQLNPWYFVPWQEKTAGRACAHEPGGRRSVNQMGTGHLASPSHRKGNGSGAGKSRVPGAW